jgi:hypothetical protein
MGEFLLGPMQNYQAILPEGITGLTKPQTK